MISPKLCKIVSSHITSPNDRLESIKFLKPTDERNLNLTLSIDDFLLEMKENPNYSKKYRTQFQTDLESQQDNPTLIFEISTIDFHFQGSVKTLLMFKQLDENIQTCKKLKNKGAQTTGTSSDSVNEIVSRDCIDGSNKSSSDSNLEKEISQF